MLTLILFILILSVLIFVHEVGHFLMAKKNGILVEEFGFGLPPRIWGKKIGETIYSLNLLPIGGFVKLYGEDGVESEELKTQSGRLKGRAFFEKSILGRISVVLAGVTMNFLLSVFLFATIYSFAGIPVKTDKVKVVGVAKGSPAEEIGLKLDDQVVSLNGKPIKDIDVFIKETKDKAGEVVELEVMRQKDNSCLDREVLGGKAGPGFEVSCRNGNLVISVVPRTKPPEGEGPLGVAISGMEMKHYPVWQMPFYGVREGLKESFAWGRTVLNSLVSMIGNLIFKGQMPQDIAGPIGVYQTTGIVAKSGLLALLEFLGILSVNLAVINVLPFPALDGGRLLFLGIETVFGKKIAPKIEAWVNNLGMVFLLLLMLLITINDIRRILLANHLLERLRIIF